MKKSELKKLIREVIKEQRENPRGAVNQTQEIFGHLKNAFAAADQFYPEGRKSPNEFLENIKKKLNDIFGLFGNN